MHPPLDRPHPLCQQVIKNLKQCHTENPRAKFLGACNEAKRALDDCFRMEKEEKRKQNLVKSVGGAAHKNMR
uniref:COX assembly mitochondrial protein n=1 Tax=Albugo laibachii Nc14 TaxID=890382 RepID=F0WMZ2_9STRA|nr:unnamed protein product putative [Albugo laibachii Nc14]|eukprot:CCA22679.1 unnamed protein product putative [Albugo laibachii Nc14]